MITITPRTVEGAPGMTLAEMDAETLRASTLLGGPNVPEGAAEYLRDVYRAVILVAGKVSLDVSQVAGGRTRVEVAA